MILQEHGICVWLAEAEMLDNDNTEVELLLSSKKIIYQVLISVSVSKMKR